MSSLVSSSFISCPSPSPIQTESEGNLKLPSLLIKTSLRENALCIGLGKRCGLSQYLFPCLPPFRSLFFTMSLLRCSLPSWSLLPVPLRPLLSVSDHLAPLVRFWPLRFMPHLSQVCRGPLCKPLADMPVLVSFVVVVLVTGLPLLLFWPLVRWPCPEVILTPWIGQLSVAVCSASTLPIAGGILVGKRSTCLPRSNDWRLLHL